MSHRWLTVSAFSLMLLAPVAWAAGPSVSEVVQTIQAGHLDRAQTMMKEVLAAHPGSAEAQYVEARILARQGQWKSALRYLDRAKKLDPAMSFVKPDVFSRFERSVVRHVPAAAGQGRALVSSPGKRHVSGVGAVLAWFLGLVAVIAAISWLMRRRRERQMLACRTMNTGFGNPYYGPQGQPFPPGGGSAGVGSGIVSGIATGLGLGAGMAAGSALANSLFDPDGTGNVNGLEDGGNLGLTSDSWGDDGSSSSGDGFGLGDDGDTWT